MRRTRRKRKNGARGAALLAGLILAVLLWTAPALAVAAGAPYALIAGTVFRDPGFALPGAEVALSVRAAPEKGKRPKPQKALSDRRGEFAFRVPAGKAQYVLTVQAKGFAGEEKTVDISGEERVDVYFYLKPTAH
jgi:hypothetical protein